MIVHRFIAKRREYSSGIDKSDGVCVLVGTKEHVFQDVFAKGLTLSKSVGALNGLWGKALFDDSTVE